MVEFKCPETGVTFGPVWGPVDANAARQFFVVPLNTQNIMFGIFEYRAGLRYFICQINDLDQATRRCDELNWPV
jgi:hypothetical protein